MVSQCAMPGKQQHHCRRWSACPPHAAHHPTSFIPGQGLARGRNQLASSSRGALALQQQYMQSLQRAQSLSARYRQMTSTQKQACAGRNNKASLCGPLTAGDADVMLLATSPQSFSWHAGSSSSSTALPAPSPFGKVGNQEDCWTCERLACMYACMQQQIACTGRAATASTAR